MSTPQKETLELIGKLVEPGVGRDAVHIAVIPAMCEIRVQPGDWVGVSPHDPNLVHPDYRPKVGIVDPFLPGSVSPGNRFFVFLAPQTITSLRHVWTHPAFPDEETPCNRG